MGSGDIKPRMLSAGGARARIGGLGLGLLAAGVLAGGCSKSGSYRIEWQFADSFQSGDCGRVGVGGIRITAVNGGSQDVRAVPCGPGFYDGGLDEGSWTLTLVALDATGQVKDQRAGTTYLNGQFASPIDIHTGEMAAPIPAMTLTPLPQCRDGVDNDRDGRVDLDDADCAGNPDADTECGASDGASCDDNRPGMAP